MSTHTPGPWHAREWNCHAPTSVGAVVNGEFQLVAECSGTGARDRQTEIESANAHLIAAAPDMLEALKGALDVINALIPGPHLTIRAAIAKAEGAK
jgi:hypothetical protein